MTEERTMLSIDIRRSPGFHGRCYGGPNHLKSAGCMVPYLTVPIPPELSVGFDPRDASNKLGDGWKTCEYTFERWRWPRDFREDLWVGFFLAEDYTLTISDRYQLYDDAMLLQDLRKNYEQS